MQLSGLLFPIKFNLSSEDTCNLKALWDRKKGEYLYRDKTGCLKTMGLWQRIHYCFSGSYRETVNRELRSTIHHLTKNLSIESIQSDVKEVFLTDFFLQKLAPLSRTIHKRKIHYSVVDLLSKKISTGQLAPEATEIFRHTYKTAKLWGALGNFESMSGNSGTYRIIKGKEIGRESKKVSLGIFKPSDEEPLAKMNRKTIQKIKYFLLQTILKPFRGSLFHCTHGQAYLAEVFAKKAEKHVLDAVNDYLRTHDIEVGTGKILEHLALVQETHVTSFKIGKNPNERVGSFQLWLQEPHLEASRYFHVSDLYRQPLFGKERAEFLEKIKQFPPELFDLLVILDYVTGNCDRHGGNWLVLYDDQKQATGIRLIDGGWSLLPAHPGPWSLFELGKKYLWRRLPLANRPFTDLGKNVIESLYKMRSKLKDDLWNLYYKNMPQASEITFQRMLRMDERVQVLNANRTLSTKRELGNIRMQRQVERVLKAQQFS